MSTRKQQRQLEARGGAYATGSCPSGKRCHQSRRSAKAHAASLRQPRVREYRCHLCGFWHVGHLPAVVRKRPGHGQ